MTVPLPHRVSDNVEEHYESSSCPEYQTTTVGNDVNIVE
jgi:hypothetical protein